MNVPIRYIDEDAVNEAYEAYSALQRTACREPGLLQNEHFKALQDTAYARFLARFEAR